MSNTVLKIVVTVAAFVLVIIGYDCSRRAQASRWEARVDKVSEVARRETARADSLIAVATDARKRADAMVTVAETKSRAVQTRILRIRELTPAAPDTCGPFVAARDSVIDDLTNVNSTLMLAHRESTAALDTLARAFGIVHGQVDSLSAVLHTRPRQRSRLVPRVAAGPFVGICSDLRPCMGAGVTLSWSVFR